MEIIVKNIYQKSDFSLIELLAVIVIALILIGITIPAFNTLTKGQNVEAAARTIGSQLKAVRAYAITKREYIALIIPATASIPANYLKKSYRSCIVSSSYVFEEWVPGEKWEFLPTSAAILDVTNSPGYTDGAFSSAKTVTGVNFSDIGGGSSVDAKAIVFTPTGKCAGVRKYVVIGDAVVLEDGVSSTANQINITIDLYSGRISYGSD